MFLMYNNSMKKTYVHHNANDADFTLNNILDISNQGFWDWNVATGHVYRSIGWFHMLGYDYDSCKNDVFTWEDIIHEDDYPHVMAHFEAYVTGKSDVYQIMYRCRKCDGSYLWIEDSGKIVQRKEDGSALRMIGAHTNIHEAKLLKDSLIQKNKLLANDNAQLEMLVKERTKELNEINEKLNLQIEEAHYNASHDVLTSLFNRREFERLLDKEIDRARRYMYPLSIVLMDIDNFKTINDQYGHKKGDQALIDMSAFVKRMIRSSDVLARWGGEEFMIIFPESNLTTTIEKIESIRKAIAQNLFAENLNMTCSFGVTTYQNEDTKDSIFLRCDQLLYMAKNTNKNNIQFQ